MSQFKKDENGEEYFFGRAGGRDFTPELEKYDWKGYRPWGNYGDSLWRLGPPSDCQHSVAVELRITG
ncbi:MAG: hypothetical protein L0Y56_00650 [Nitrospira sp.]|nr:hypothetical protein [Nitrospira sp.]